MTDTPDQPDPPPPALADFTPVPRRFNRGDVWTDELQRDFIEALADTGSVEAACRTVGRSPASAYRLRRHPLGDGFAAAWQAAIDCGIRRIEDNAVDRAVNGVEVPVFIHGGEVITRRAYNDRLAMFMLRSRMPERYCERGARSLSAIDARSLARLKQQWRAEWERERQLEEDEEERETLDSIDRFIDNMAQNRWSNMSPRARAAYDEYKRIEAEDGVNWMLDEDGEADDDAPPLPGLLEVPGPAAEASPQPGRGACPEPDQSTGVEPPPGPRIRSLKGEWD